MSINVTIPRTKIIASSVRKEAESTSEDISINIVATRGEFTLSSTQGLSGRDGITPELRSDGTHVQYRLDSDWINLVSIAEISGEDGVDGQTPQIRNSGGYIQVSLNGINWTNLVALSALTGVKGDTGATGAGFTTLVNKGNVSIVGGTVTKISGQYGWDASAHSLEGYAGDVMAIARIDNVQSDIMVGLNSDPELNAGYDTIDHTVYIAGAGFQAWENGGQVFIGGPLISDGDFVYVRRRGSKVEYGVLGEAAPRFVRPGTVDPSIKLFFDSSIVQIGTSFSCTALMPLATDGRDGIDGADSTVPGPAGPGVPTGGTGGQLLAKIDGTDYNTQWIAVPAGDVKLAGGNTFTGGAQIFAPGATGYASIRIGKGVAPTSPVDGDMWRDSTGSLYLRKDTATRSVVTNDGATFAGRVVTAASAGGAAGLNIPAGTAPTSPSAGDVWGTTTGLFYRTASATLSFMPSTGGTFTGKVNLPASTTSAAPLNLGQSSNTPTSPVNGDIWIDDFGLNYQYYGSTYQVPIGAPATFSNNTWTGVNTFSGPSARISLAQISGGASRFNMAPGPSSPTTPAAGDLWNVGGVLKFRKASTTVDIVTSDAIPSSKYITGTAANSAGYASGQKVLMRSSDSFLYQSSGAALGDECWICSTEAPYSNAGNTTTATVGGYSFTYVVGLIAHGVFDGSAWKVYYEVPIYPLFSGDY